MLAGGQRMLEPEDALDVRRMIRDRAAKALDAMRSEDVGAFILTKPRNVRYATGSVSQTTDGTQEIYIPTLAIVPADGTPPHVFTAYPEGVPDSIPQAHVHDPLRLEFSAGASQLVVLLKEYLGSAVEGKVGIDSWTWQTYHVLREELPKAEFVDADFVLNPVRYVKTDDEMRCLVVAQQLTDAAMYRLYEDFSPGITETELAGRFNHIMADLGVPIQHIDPFFCVTQPVSPDTEPPPFRHTNRNRPLIEGDVVLTDTGAMYMGYVSDMGTTWYCGRHTKPNQRQKDLYKRWQEIVDNTLEACKPGNTSQDLLKAGLRNWPEDAPKPWPKGLYLAHGMGLEGEEGPYVGTDLGVDVENALPLQPNVPLALEPYVYESGVGAFRHELLVYVTEDGYEIYGEPPFGLLVD